MIVKGGKSKRRVRIDASFDDGTRIAGTFVVRNDPPEVERFENRYAGDVQALAGRNTAPLR